LVLTIVQDAHQAAERSLGVRALAQIAAQAAPSGRLPSAEAWHEQFKRQFIAIELPNGQVIGESSAKLSTAEFSEFYTQVEAFAATELALLYDLLTA
jgi:hypothetical protein